MTALKLNFPCDLYFNLVYLLFLLGFLVSYVYAPSKIDNTIKNMINNGDNVASYHFWPQIIFNSIFSHASILTLSITNCHIYSFFVIY